MAKTLTVYLAADLRKFNAGLASAEGSLTGFSGGIGGMASSLQNMLGPALIGAGIAAAAFATKLAVDAAQAAIAEEAELTRLNTTLTNLGFGAASEQVNRFVDDMQFASGVADSDLRNALDRLLRSTGSVEEAQRALKIALDASVGAGKPLQSVADALGKAYDGNTTALGKLGIGLDRATLASGDLNAITSKMADTFAGQSAKAADTLQGRMDRLGIAVDELKESFGKGLLPTTRDVGVQMDDLTQSLRDFQPAAEGAGKQVRNFASDLLKDAKSWFDFTQGAADAQDLLRVLALMGFPGAAQAASAMGDAVYRSAKDFEYLQYAAYGAAAAVNSVSGAASASLNSEQSYWAAFYGGNDFAQRQLAEATNNQKNLWHDWTKAADSARGGASGLTAENDKLKKAFDAQKIAVDASNTALENAVGKWQAAKQAVTDYAQNMSEKLLGGIDLGAAYKSQFDEAGKRTGKTLVDALTAQIDQAKWFSNVLLEIKRQGADQSLIEQIASLGPGTGGALAQQMITDGIVPTINDKWTAVRTEMQQQGAALVPDALLAGQDYAAGLVVGTAQQLLKDEDKLKKIGKKMGELVGSNIKAEVLSAIADAIAAAEGARTASAAKAAASSSGQAAAATQQSYVQTLNQIINNSNNRTGYTTQQLYQMGVLH